MKGYRLLAVVAFVVIAAFAVYVLSQNDTKNINTLPEGSNDGDSLFSVAMVTDIGGINDESFNQSAWSGMERLRQEGVQVSFVESNKDADYAPNLEKKIDEGSDIIWAVGFLMKTAVGDAARDNPEQLFGLVDDAFAEGEHPNVVSVTFRPEESSFLVGYAAALKTETNRVGMILGMESPTMNRFTNGFRAGVAYGAKERGEKVAVDYQVAESFNDSPKGKAIAQRMYVDGADIVYQAAGDTGRGAIEAAKELGKWVIGTDLDQNHLAPQSVLCTALKDVGGAVYLVSKRVEEGEKLGGRVLYLGLADEGVGVSTTGDLLGREIIDKLDTVTEKIKNSALVIPSDDIRLANFMSSLDDE